jgi:tetratricopeptide (TPR) repeat protein
MKPQMRCAGFFAASLVMGAAAFWGGVPARGAGFSPEQAAPAAASPPAPTPPPKVLTLEQRADIFMARKNYADAADYYYRALKQSSFKDPVVWNKLGIAFQEDSKFHSARKAYTHATRVDKNFAAAWNNLGTVLFMEQKYARSVKYYRRAIELEGDNATLHMNLGIS